MGLCTSGAIINCLYIKQKQAVSHRAEQTSSHNPIIKTTHVTVAQWFILTLLMLVITLHLHFSKYLTSFILKHTAWSPDLSTTITHWLLFTQQRLFDQFSHTPPGSAAHVTVLIVMVTYICGDFLVISLLLYNKVRLSWVWAHCLVVIAEREFAPKIVFIIRYLWWMWWCRAIWPLQICERVFQTLTNV